MRDGFSGEQRYTRGTDEERETAPCTFLESIHRIPVLNIIPIAHHDEL